MTARQLGSLIEQRQYEIACKESPGVPLFYVYTEMLKTGRALEIAKEVIKENDVKFPLDKEDDEVKVYDFIGSS